VVTVTPAGGVKRVLFLNENIGGHRTVHLNFERIFRQSDEVDPEFVHLPPRGLVRKAIGIRWPGLARRDLDLQALRTQLAAATLARRHLIEHGFTRHGAPFSALHAYCQNSTLLVPDLMRALPTVISADGTNELLGYRLPYREPTRHTPLMVAAARPLERRAYQAATLLVANSRFAGDSLLGYGVPSGRLRILPFGILPPEAVHRRPDPHRPRITFVGQQLGRKGANLLLNVYERHLRHRCELVLVTTARVAPRPGVVVHSDVRPGDGKIDQILAGTSLFVFPSSVDHSPNAVLEAMAHAVPVVAARSGGIPEMVQHGKTGLLVEPGDGSGLLAAITALLDHPGRAEDLGAAAREAVLEDFDIRRRAVELLEVVDEAITVYDRRGPVEAELGGYRRRSRSSRSVVEIPGV
jgi:starch synthase